MSLLLNGTDLKDQNTTDSQAILTISQMILFNFNLYTSSTAKSRHSLDREPPLPLCVGMKIHTETRSKKIITQLYNLGFCLSYDRIIQLENQLATVVCKDFHDKKTVVPAQLQHGLFTTLVHLIIWIIILQVQPPRVHFMAQESISYFCKIRKYVVKAITLHLPGVKKSHQLPDYYATVPAVALQTTKVLVPQQLTVSVSQENQLENAQLKENSWLVHASKLLENHEVKSGDTISWSAFHASLQDKSEDLSTSLTQLLPLFYEKTSTAAMIKHGTTALQRATEFFNPGQIPVMAFDVPLFALAKFVQWKWPEIHGESKFITIFGGLHIEMAMWKTNGDWIWMDYLEGSGWTTWKDLDGLLHSQ